MAILGYCPGKVGFGGIREPARRKLRNCVQISMPCGFKAERLCGAALVRAPERRAFCAVRVNGRRIPKGARENSLKNKTKLGWACGGGWGHSASLFCGLLGIVTL